MIIVLVFFALYAVMLALFALKLMSANNTKDASVLLENEYTILIAARNEEANIEKCIEALLSQTLKPLAIIVVDDNSEDKTSEILADISQKNSIVKHIICRENVVGKSKALQEALKFVETEIVLTIDADCFPTERWAESLIYKLKSKKLITGPVIVASSNNFRKNMEYAETLFLIGFGAGAASFGLMFQASGANMAFYKTDFESFYNTNAAGKYKSGDDVYFLQYIQKKYGLKSASFASSPSSVVETGACENFSSWIKQRVRWASKAPGYFSILPFVFGGIVALINVLFLLTIIYAIINGFDLFSISVLCLKIFSELLLLVSCSQSWEIKTKIFYFLFLPVFYPFFLLSVGISLLFFKNRVKWKGRPCVK